MYGGPRVGTTDSYSLLSSHFTAFKNGEKNQAENSGSYFCAESAALLSLATVKDSSSKAKKKAAGLQLGRAEVNPTGREYTGRMKDTNFQGRKSNL